MKNKGKNIIGGPQTPPELIEAIKQLGFKKVLDDLGIPYLPDPESEREQMEVLHRWIPKRHWRTGINKLIKTSAQWWREAKPL